MLLLFENAAVALLVARPNCENKSIVGSFCYENMYWLLLVLLLILNGSLLRFDVIFWEGNPNELKVLLLPFVFILLNMLLLSILLKFEEFWLGLVTNISNGFREFDAVFVGFWLKNEVALLLMLLLKELLGIPKLLLLLEGKKDVDPPPIVVTLFYWRGGDKPIEEVENISNPLPPPIGLKEDFELSDDYGIVAVKKLNGSSDLFSYEFWAKLVWKRLLDGLLSRRLLLLDINILSNIELDVYILSTSPPFF